MQRFRYSRHPIIRETLIHAMKRKNFLKRFALLCLLLSFSSCDKGEEDAQPVEVIMPLEVGNEWLYKVIDYNSEGDVLSTSSFKRAVVRDTLINQQTWFILNNGMIVRNDRDGYVHFRKDVKEQYITYPSQSTSGIAYGYEYPDYTLWIFHRKTANLVPLQDSPHASQANEYTFERQTSQKASSALSTTWVKEYVIPALGMIRTDWYYADSDKLMRRYELESYHVK